MAAANFSLKAAFVAAAILCCCATLGRPMRSPLARQFDRNTTNVTVVYMTPHDEFVVGKPISKSSEVCDAETRLRGARFCSYELDRIIILTLCSYI